MLNPRLLGTLLPREVWLMALAARAGKVPLPLPYIVLLGKTVRVVQDIHHHAFFSQSFDYRSNFCNVCTVLPLLSIQTDLILLLCASLHFSDTVDFFVAVVLLVLDFFFFFKKLKICGNPAL